MRKDIIYIKNDRSLRYYRGYIVYQASYNHKTFRYNIIRVPKESVCLKPFGLIDSEAIDANAIAREVSNKAAEIDEAFYYLKDKGQMTITKQDIDNLIIYGFKNTQKIEYSGVVEHFEDWIKDYNNRKISERIRDGREEIEGTMPSTKDFISCLNLLKDYEYDFYARKPIQITDIDMQFIEDLMRYAQSPRKPKGKHKYLTQGNLVNKTMQKRLDSLFQFLNDVTNGHLPNDITKPHLCVVDRKIIRLDNAELTQLVRLQLDNPQEERVRDYFVFLCLTGLRFGDFYKLDRSYFDPELTQLRVRSNKTFADCRIPLCTQALSIAEKYDWNFHHYTNQALNRALHDLLEKYDLFPEPISMEYMKQGRKVQTKCKRDYLTLHKGRSTFISRLAEVGASEHDIMTCTGHKKTQTLKYYLDQYGEERMKHISQMVSQLEIQ